jgi:hypothetical protein
LHGLISTKPARKDDQCSIKDASINLNLLTFYLIVVLVPFEFILDILGGSSSYSSPAEVLEVTLFAIVFAWLGRGQVHKPWWISIKFLAILWFSLCAVAVLYLTMMQGRFSNLSGATVKELLLLLVGTVLIRILWQSTTRYHNLLAFLGAALFPWIFMTTSVDLMVEAIHHLPYVYDPVLYRIDAILMLDWVSVFADLLKQHATLGRAILFNYYYIAFWGILAAISQCLNTPPSRAYLLLCTFTLGIFGFCLYYLTPAVAPFFFFGGLFPDHLPPSQTLPLHQVLSPIASFRNTMPSLHTASALLMYLALRNSPAWHRVIGAFVVLCILVSTLALGEHYAVDLIAAFPLVLLVRGVCAVYLPAGEPARRNAMLIGGILVGLWVLTVRCAPVSLELPDFIRVLACVSVAAPILFEHQLAKIECLSAFGGSLATSQAVVVESALTQTGT